jgi:hypothetical protein
MALADPLYLSSRLLLHHSNLQQHAGVCATHAGYLRIIQSKALPEIILLGYSLGKGAHASKAAEKGRRLLAPCQCADENP